MDTLSINGVWKWYLLNFSMPTDLWGMLLSCRFQFSELHGARLSSPQVTCVLLARASFCVLRCMHFLSFYFCFIFFRNSPKRTLYLPCKSYCYWCYYLIWEFCWQVLVISSILLYVAFCFFAIYKIKFLYSFFKDYFQFAIVIKHWLDSPCCITHSWPCLKPSSLYLPTATLLPCPPAHWKPLLCSLILFLFRSHR